MPRYYKDKLYEKAQREHIGAYQRTKMLERLQKEEREGGETYHRDKAEAQKAAFDRMYKNSSKNQKI